GLQRAGGDAPLVEYDLVVRPGADPADILMELETPGEVSLVEGALIVRLPSRKLCLRRPVIYQEIDGRRRPVAGSYRLRPPSGGLPAQVGFALGEYDRDYPLVIDPALDYSTFLGGTGGSNANGNDDGNGIAVNAAGQAHGAGRAQSVNFPTRNAADGSLNNGPASSHERDGFVTKLTADGSDIVFSTFVGGGNLDVCFSISLDAVGNVYAAGRTASVNFPTTPGALRTTDTDGATLDGILVKLSPTGALLYSTYVGGSSYDICHGIAAVDERDGSGNYLGSHVLVTGETRSQNFPLKNAVQTSYGGGGIDCFVLSLDADLTDATSGLGDLAYSTYVGGSGDDSGYGLCADPQGRALVTGITSSPNFPTTHDALDTARTGSSDAFVLRVDPAGVGLGSLSYSSYLGGGGNEIGYGINIDPDENVYAVGETTSTNFPTTTGAFDRVLSGNSDAFAVKLDLGQPAATQLRYGTYLGGSSSDAARQVAVSPDGKAAVVGPTTSSNFPLVSALQGDQSGQDGWVAQLNATASGLTFSSYLGGSGMDEARSVAVDGDGDLYLTGETNSSNFPTTPGAFDQTYGSVGDCWVTKITLGVVEPPPPPTGDLQFRSAATGSNGAGATSLTLPRPSGVAAGDVLVAAIATGSTSVSFTAPAGWGQVINASESTTIRTIVYRRVAVGAEPASYTWTFNSSVRAVGAAAAYSGGNPAQPIAVADGFGNAVSTAITAPGVTTPVAGTRLIHVGATAVATTIAPPGGMTERAEAVGSALTLSLSDEPRPTAGPTGSRTATAGSAARNVGHSVAVRPAP
ncbi:MAG: SBBP repeat-containing protein, partial [Actinomycetota bacterium]